MQITLESYFQVHIDFGLQYNMIMILQLGGNGTGDRPCPPMVLALLADSGWTADSLKHAVPRAPELVSLRNSTLQYCMVNKKNDSKG